MVLNIKHHTTSELIKLVRTFTSPVSSLFLYSTKPKVDSIIFKLYCVITILILACGTMFLTMKQYFGETIECITSKSDIPAGMIQRYCWMEGSFSAFSPNPYHKAEGFVGVKTPEPGDHIVHHKYYQWVYFVLILQSIVFYAPRYVWKSVEGDKLRDLIADLRDNHIASLQRFDKYRMLQDVADAMYLGSNYGVWFILCELFCLINLIFQIWFTNLFLGGQFISLGLDWYSYANSDFSIKYDPLIKIFPRFVKCSFHKFGASGTLETIDSQCFLLMNIVNEKIYVTLWFWFFFLLGCSCLVLMIRILYLVPYFRYRLLLQKAPASNKIALKRLCRSPGNWFVLYFIAKNIKPSYFTDMLDELLEVHFDKKGRRIISSQFKEEVERGNKSEIKQKKSKSKSKSSKSSKAIGWKTDDPNWDSKNEDDWASNNQTTTATTDDGWDNMTNNANTNNDTENWDNTPSAPDENWGTDENTSWPNENETNK